MAGHAVRVTGTIDAPPQAVWRVLTDLDRAAEVLTSVHEIVRLTDGPYDVGTRWRETRTMLGRTESHELTVTESLPCVRTVITTEAGGVTYATRMELEAVEPAPAKGRTRLTVTFEARHPRPTTRQRIAWTVMGPAGTLLTRAMLRRQVAEISAAAGDGRRRARTFTAASIPDLTGSVAVVTGANGGLGLESARALAAKGAQVVMAVRNTAKAEAAADAIRAAVPGASLEIVPLDLGSQASVRHAAQTILAAHPVIDLLLNNAGVMATAEGRTVDGYETQFGVDHLGHWTLTSLLLPGLLAAPAARVVTTTSMARLQAGGRLDPSDPLLERGYDPWAAYSRAKRANYHFALGLDREFRRAGVGAQSLAAHPGLAYTDLQPTAVRGGGAGRMGPLWAGLARLIGMSAADGALPQLRAATDPDASGGEFYGPRWSSRGPAVRLRVDRRGLDRAIDDLWAVSERQTGVRLDLRPR
ncbi:oxidoreductase [Raineyella fluvialis]|uniref:SDR family NAD(P)-dependent oxidoreductase n=1 Tax=Raineyella fluvialis TaxID=2662261 RepID=A0A5Q2F777_9ACTN|nr:oxidoreductase [Raineyella fluvialis]QGF22679.1 SDR family NAD(P)-dependent oxidoreductase [Raineyella fluvialis]